MRRSVRLIVALALLIVIATPGTTRAELHALIVGINEYDHEQKLDGAVADAEDIAAVAQHLGARSVTLLRNRDASRARIVEAWAEIVRRSRTGDTIIFTYAGHGGQEPWKNARGKQEKAETFLLSTFKPRGPTSSERILDKEINGWLKKAGEKRLRIIFVADSCHSGGMLRSLDRRAGPTFRSAPPYGVPDVPLSIPASDEAAPQDLAHVTFFAATQADRKVPEVVINGRKRGALSYAFSRALEGEADRQGRGQLSNFDLQSYVTSTVRQLSEAQQTPEVTYRSGGEHEMLLTGIPKSSPRDPQLSDLRLRIDNAESALKEGLGKSLAGVQIVAAGPADLIWDAKERIALSGIGDPIAHDVTFVKLQGIVDKWRALPPIKELVAAKPLIMSLAPDDGRHPLNKIITFSSAPVPHPYVTVFNLAPDGTIQFLYPRVDKGDPPDGKWGSGKPYVLQLEVNHPLGADHLLVIASASLLHALHLQLQKAPKASELPRHLKAALVSGDYVIGLHSLYTQAAEAKQ